MREGVAITSDRHGVISGQFGGLTGAGVGGSTGFDWPKTRVSGREVRAAFPLAFNGWGSIVGAEAARRLRKMESS